MESEPKRPPAEKPLALPMSFDDALRMIATGGKPETKRRAKPAIRKKKK